MTERPFFSTLITLINEYSLLILTGGCGVIDIDFKHRYYTAGEIIALAPGQYIRLITGNLCITLVEFSADEVVQVVNTQLLFRHLTDVAHVPISKSALMQSGSQVFLTALIQSWNQLNPFAASTPEIELLFSLKAVIDNEFRKPISLLSIANTLHEKPDRINTIIKNKTGYSVHQLHQQKLLLEAQRQVIFSTDTTKSISYDLGFRDPAYFNRFFKQQTGKTPHQFRDDYPTPDNDPFMTDLTEFISLHISKLRPASFYANQFSLTEATLSRKIQKQSGMTLFQLIQHKQVDHARTMLRTGLSITRVASDLGFSEPNHFSTFFKNMTGQTPGDFRGSGQKVQSFGGMAYESH